MPESTRRRLDHVVHAVRDLDATANRYRELGFTVTDRSDHPFGTSNRLVVLDRSYLEIVALTDERSVPTDGFPATVHRFLEGRGEGVPFLAFRTDAAAADHATLSRMGLASGEVLSFSRTATLADGRKGEARFSCVFTPGFSELGIFLCQHHTPEMVWDPGRPAHPNGATRIEQVRCDGGRGVEVGRLLQAITGAQGEQADGDTRFRLDGADLVLTGGGDGPSVRELRFGDGDEVEVGGIRLRLPSLP